MSAQLQDNAGDKGDAWAPLRQRIFLGLWLASIASNIGTWMHEVGAGWLMTSLSSSPMTVALVQVAGAAPMFFLALPAGALADIVDKRRYLMAVQLWMASMALLLTVLSLMGLMTAPLLLLLTLGMGLGTALMMPAWSALTPELVPGEQLPAAIVLSSVGTNVARAVGPAIAGVVVSLVGPWATFAVNAVSFFAVIGVLFFWQPIVKVQVLPAERLLSAIRVGWRFARSSRPLQRVIIRTLAFFVGASAGMSLLPLLVRGELAGSAADYGVMLGSVGVGAVGGAMLLPRIKRVLSSDRLVAIASLIYALVLFALAFVRDFKLLVPVMLISGGAWIAVLSSLQVAAQTSVPAWVRARALAVYILAFFGSMAVGGTLWGFIASHSSIATALTAAGSLLVLGVLVSWRVQLPVTAKDDLAPSLHWPQPLIDVDTPHDRGPVMITVEYQVAAEHWAEFQACMQEVRRMRQRNGSFSWGLVQDTEHAQRWLEFFFDESWTGHLRHHTRVTRAELKIEAAARRFQRDGIPIHIRHLLAGNAE